jgi:ABC-type dipeptide/oligopeptide/nickel transport system permease subunit
MEKPIKKGVFSSILPHFIREKNLLIGTILLLFFILIAFLAPLIAPYAIDEGLLSEALSGPSGKHLLGTDQIGRDLFSRIVFGARTSLSVALFGVTISYLIAFPFGLMAGFLGKKVDRVISYISESILTFPSIVLAIFIVSLTGGGKKGLIITLIVTQVPQFIRYIRGLVLQIAKQEYIEASRAIGSNNTFIMFRHILRNTVGPTSVIFSLLASEAVLVVAALGFLGLGVVPPEPEWGTMLSASRDFFFDYPHLMLYPGLSIALLILAFNLVGDGLRDYFDSKSAMTKGNA